MKKNLRIFSKKKINKTIHLLFDIFTTGLFLFLGYKYGALALFIGVYLIIYGNIIGAINQFELDRNLNKKGDTI
jgi:hypothetical protein